LDIVNPEEDPGRGSKDTIVVPRDGKFLIVAFGVRSNVQDLATDNVDGACASALETVSVSDSDGGGGRIARQKGVEIDDSERDCGREDGAVIRLGNDNVSLCEGLSIVVCRVKRDRDGTSASDNGRIVIGNVDECAARCKVAAWIGDGECGDTASNGEEKARRIARGKRDNFITVIRSSGSVERDDGSTSSAACSNGFWLVACDGRVDVIDNVDGKRAADRRDSIRGTKGDTRCSHGKV